MAAMLVSIASRFVCDPDGDASVPTITSDDQEEATEVDDSSTEEPPDSCAPPPDAMQIVMEFIRPRLAGLSGKNNIAADLLFAELVANAGHLRACPQLASFISLVRKMFGVTCRNMVLSFPGATRESKAAEFIDAHVDFMPMRTIEFFAWIPEKDLVTAFWTWYNNNREDKDDKNTKTEWKAVIKNVMHSKGRILRTIRPVVGNIQVDVVVYDMVAWK